MRVLTDTHTLVWALSSPEQLSNTARKVLSRSEVSVSVVNLWELVLKKEKIGALLSDPVVWWDMYVTANGYAGLSVRTVHIRALARLPELHKDPFDRLLVAQSIVENMPLVSKDQFISKYGISVIW